MTMLMLVGAIVAPLWPTARPALTAAAVETAPAAVEVKALVTEAADDRYADQGSVATPTTVYATLDSWSLATRVPDPSPTPLATPAPVQGVQGPRSLTLWNGKGIPIFPATAERQVVEGWGEDLYRWQVPEADAGWHTNTSDCGAGVTVIGGHVSYNGLPGVFAELPAIGAGERVLCVDDQGREHRFAPVDYVMVSANESPATWTPSWSPALLLYTCTPELNGQIIVVRFQEEDQL